MKAGRKVSDGETEYSIQGKYLTLGNGSPLEKGGEPSEASPKSKDENSLKVGCIRLDKNNLPFLEEDAEFLAALKEVK